MTENLLPELHFPAGFHYECISCGRCCRQDWDVHISRSEYENLKNSDLCREIQEKSGPEEILTCDEEKGVATIRNIHGHCPMLDDRNLCRIHSTMGVEAKPYTCRQLPIAMVLTPDGVYVGGSFICRQMWENVGRPIESYREEIEGWMSELRKEEKIGQKIAFSSRVNTTWEAYHMVEDFVRERIKGDESFTFRLWRALIPLLVADINMVSQGIGEIDARGLSRQLAEASKTDIKKDEMFFMNERSLAYSILSLLESASDEHTKENTRILLNGGVLYCQSLGREIDTRKLAEYASRNPAPWRDIYYEHYVEHLLWRKYLVDHQPLTDSLAMLCVLEHLFTWYFYCSAYRRRAASPFTSDAKFGVSKVELLVLHHNVYNIIKPFGSLYADNLRSQMEVMLEPV